MAGSTFASRSYRDTAVILRTQNLGEADRIITALTPHHGVVRAVAKGVRRTSSKFGATVEPFMVADAQFVHGRSLDIITQATSRATYGSLIVADYDKYTAASTMVEAAERISEADVDSTRGQFALLYGALSALARGLHAADLIMNSYLLRALSTAGWAMTWTVCVNCGSQGPHHGFHAGAGGPVCMDCRPPGTISMAPDTTRLLHALQHGQWEATETARQDIRFEAGHIVSSYVDHHLERRLNSSRMSES